MKADTFSDSDDEMDEITDPNRIAPEANLEKFEWFRYKRYELFEQALTYPKEKDSPRPTTESLQANASPFDLWVEPDPKPSQITPIIARHHECRKQDFSTVSKINFDVPEKRGRNLSSAFTEFTNLDGSVKGFLEFAAKYGDLTEGTEFYLPEYGFDKGTPLSIWRAEHLAAKTLVKIHDSLTTKLDISELEAVLNELQTPSKIRIAKTFFNSAVYLIRGDSDKYSMFLLPAPTSKAASAIQVSSLLTKESIAEYRRILSGQRLNRDEDIIFRAKQLLTHIIQSKTSLNPCRMLVLSNGDNLTLKAVPDTLLASLWYQAAQYITGQRKIKQCRICLKWRDVTGRRDDWEHDRVCYENADKKALREKERETKKAMGTYRAPGRPPKQKEESKCEDRLNGADPTVSGSSSATA